MSADVGVGEAGTEPAHRDVEGDSLGGGELGEGKETMERAGDEETGVLGAAKGGETFVEEAGLAGEEVAFGGDGEDGGEGAQGGIAGQKGGGDGVGAGGGGIHVNAGEGLGEGSGEEDDILVGTVFGGAVRIKGEDGVIEDETVGDARGDKGGDDREVAAGGVAGDEEGAIGEAGAEGLHMVTHHAGGDGEGILRGEGVIERPDLDGGLLGERGAEGLVRAGAADGPSAAMEVNERGLGFASGGIDGPRPLLAEGDLAFVRGVKGGGIALRAGDGLTPSGEGGGVAGAGGMERIHVRLVRGAAGFVIGHEGRALVREGRTFRGASRAEHHQDRQGADRAKP